MDSTETLPAVTEAAPSAENANPPPAKRVVSTSKLPVPRKQASNRNLRQSISSDALQQVALSNTNTHSLRPLGAAAKQPMVPKKTTSSTASNSGNVITIGKSVTVKTSKNVPPSIKLGPSKGSASKPSILTPTKSTFAELSIKAPPSKVPQRALSTTAAQRRASAIYHPTASSLAKKTSSSTLSSTQSASRRASASILPSASGSISKKPSSPSLSRKSSTTESSNANPALNKRAFVNQPKEIKTPLSKRPSVPHSQPPAMMRRVSNAVLNKKPSGNNLNLPPNDNDVTPTPKGKAAGGPPPTTPRTPTTARSPFNKTMSRKKLTATLNLSAPNSEAGFMSPPPTGSPSRPKSNASQTLRETIAKARAARMAAIQKETVTGVGDNDFDEFGTNCQDPFNQGFESQTERLIKRKVQSARIEGRLNIANMELKEIPKEVYKMYEAQVDDDTGSDPKWYESVDLFRLVAADNDIAQLGEELAQTFGGLTALDMHNNLLTELPQNVPRLTQLTLLNLTNNKLENASLNIIFQLATLVDLKLGKNCFDGDFSPSIDQLKNLETLEIHGNKLKSIPESLNTLSRLRHLDVSNNALDRIPFEALKECPLVSLNLSFNFMKGTLIALEVGELKSLQIFDLRGNRLSSLCDGPLVMPALQQFFASNNELSSLPAVNTWTELLVFVADYNQFEKIPDGMSSLTKIKRMDFTANNITYLEPALGAIESLDVLKFDGNPLRERSLIGISSADLKRTLKGRLAPEEGVEDEPEEEVIELRPGGILDLSRKEIDDLSRSVLELVTPAPVSIEAHHNNLTVIPLSVEIFTASLTSLNISHNKLNGDSYLPQKICLKWLTTLTLATNSITSIKPIIHNLDSPKLEQLDISANRVTDITGLRPTFSMLTRLYAKENQIAEIPVDTVDGMKILDLSSNAIESLPPRLGLCMTLRELRVEGNKFRVPRWQVLEKGTEAILTWLRDKLPPDDAFQDSLDTGVEE